MVAPDRTRGLDVRFSFSHVSPMWTSGGAMRSSEGSAKFGARGRQGCGRGDLECQHHLAAQSTQEAELRTQLVMTVTMLAPTMVGILSLIAASTNERRYRLLRPNGSDGDVSLACLLLDPGQTVASINAQRGVRGSRRLTAAARPKCPAITRVDSGDPASATECAHL
jgi:hypothetical protein